MPAMMWGKWRSATNNYYEEVVTDTAVMPTNIADTTVVSAIDRHDRRGS